MTSWIGLDHLQGTLVWLACTILLFAASTALNWRLRKTPLINPTLVTIAAIAAILICTGVPYKTYFKDVAILHYLLGTAVVALALPLYRNIRRLQDHCIRIGAALFAGSVASILVGLSVAILAHASASTVLSLAPKSATTAVSLEISRLIGGVPALTAALTILTGIIGAVVGPTCSIFCAFGNPRRAVWRWALPAMASRPRARLLRVKWPAALPDSEWCSTPSSRRCSSHRSSAWLDTGEARTPSSER